MKIQTLFIPETGIKLKLFKPWTFQCIPEPRNKGMFDYWNQHYHPREYIYNDNPKGAEYSFERIHWRENNRVEKVYVHIKPETGKAFRCCLAAGNVLTVDRVYIRQGQARRGKNNYNSLSFKWRPDPKGKIVRFFARLEDVNGMQAMVLKEEDATT